MDEPTRQLNVTLTYPHSAEYEFYTKIDVIDLDVEAQQDISSGNGFVISAPKSSNKKDMKNIMAKKKTVKKREITKPARAKDPEKRIVFP